VANSSRGRDRGGQCLTHGVVADLTLAARQESRGGRDRGVQLRGRGLIRRAGVRQAPIGRSRAHLCRQSGDGARGGRSRGRGRSVGGRLLLTRPIARASRNGGRKGSLQLPCQIGTGQGAVLGERSLTGSLRSRQLSGRGVDRRGRRGQPRVHSRIPASPRRAGAASDEHHGDKADGGGPQQATTSTALGLSARAYPLNDRCHPGFPLPPVRDAWAFLPAPADVDRRDHPICVDSGRLSPVWVAGVWVDPDATFTDKVKDRAARVAIPRFGMMCVCRVSPVPQGCQRG